MPFFARPNLDDTQFKQLPSSQLSLSGQTRILTISGLTLANNSAGTSYPNIVITAEDADIHVGDVLTYDGVGKIKLLPSGAGGDPIYPASCKSPASVSLCGISAGFVLTGKTLSNILETLLVPTLNPTVTEPYHQSMSINPPTTLYEAGQSVSISVTSVFNRGTIAPYYGTNPPSTCVPSVPRSGLATLYCYNVQGADCTPTASNPYALAPMTIVAGVNNISGRVAYAAGTNPVYDSTGTQISPAAPAGTTTPAKQITLTGIYPYFWGKVSVPGPAGSGRPTATNALVNSGTKVVADSTGTIIINWNSTPNDYIWFATPATSTTKTKWADTVVVVNNGDIGGVVSAGGNLFPIPDNVSVTTALWSGQLYKVYISNYQTQSLNPIQLKNS